MASTNPTHAPPPDSSTPTSNSRTWRFAMLIIRPAAAGMAAWSLYTVARHYHVPQALALLSGAVFDGIAIACAYLASEAIRAGRSAGAPITAAIALASVSVYLNVVHAGLVGGGIPAGVLYATPTLGLTVVSVLGWSAARAAARDARGESPMRLPAFGLLGWALAREQAWAELKERAEAHVSGGATPAHRPASATIPAIAERLDTEPAQLPAEEPHHAIGGTMHHDAPQLSGVPQATAITTMARHLGGLDTAPALVAHHLAQQGVTVKDGYVRTALSRARKAEQAETAAAAARQAAHEHRYGNGGII